MSTRTPDKQTTDSRPAPGDNVTETIEKPEPGPLSKDTPVLEAHGLVKTWGHVIGLAEVDLRLNAGEVLGIIGDNGAGKSTLIKCLTGALIPDRGEILLEGKRVDFKSPLDSRLAGIETVYQTLAVSPALDIASNMFLGRERRAPGVLGLVTRKLDKRGMVKQAQEQMTRLGISTLQDMNQRVEVLSGGQRQAVAVARAAAFGSKVIILDEPTAALGVQETARVLDIIRVLKRQGITILMISHNLRQVFGLADSIWVLRHGQMVGKREVHTTRPEEIVSMITGVDQATGDEFA